MHKRDPWIICPVCEGEGETVNPDIDGSGLTAEDFAADPDFAESYMSGAYDIACKACSGAGKIRRSHTKTLERNAADRQLAAMEDGDWEGVSYARDWRFG